MSGSTDPAGRADPAGDAKNTADGFSPPENPLSAGLPWVRGLINFDLRDPLQQVLGSDPADLSETPVEAVRSIHTTGFTLTIFAHRGEGQDVANLLAARTDLVGMITNHAEDYTSRGIDSFEVNALTGEQVRRVERAARERIRELGSLWENREASWEGNPETEETRL